MTADRPPGEPALRVIRGDATPEELAAVVAVLLSRRSARPDLADLDRADHHNAARPRPSTWSDRSRLLRRPPHPGPGAWRRSALPG